LPDNAYLSRANCTLVAWKGRKPLIRPKANTKPSGRGSTAWREMLAFYRWDGEAFMARYQGRSRAESVWAVLKRVYGNALSSRKRRMQRIELHLRIIAYNMGIANRLWVEAKASRPSGSKLNALLNHE